ncbi:AmmeMemoRadiSam system protein A [Propionibacterium sp.]|uniref:AmmeMemoRadiSam system protein A n=1 Tax=Propionibacterium sp. TaxID=1977903 RepID=UPI0039ECEFEE
MTKNDDQAVDALPGDAGAVLVGIARRTLEEELGIERTGSPASTRDHEPAVTSDVEATTVGSGRPGRPAWLDRDGASFVTLTIGGALRGCIGSLTAYRPLREDVARNAHNAAFEDPRFPPLGADEYPGTAVEVSVLGAPEPVPARTEDELIAALRPGTDGVILREGHHRATFLPQVWEQLPDPHEFLQALRHKAGLRADRWAGSTTAERYTVTAYTDLAGEDMLAHDHKDS